MLRSLGIPARLAVGFAQGERDDNEFIVRKLVEGAADALVRHGAASDDVTTVWTPGSFEIPAVARRLAGSGRFDAVVCLAAPPDFGAVGFWYRDFTPARGRPGRAPG